MNGVLKNLIKVGRVSSVNPKTVTARVEFEAQELVSSDLLILQRQTLKNKDYCLPDVGEHVVCIFLPTGNAEGFILGAIYSSDDPPVNNVNKRMVKFSDGTKVEYDRSSRTLTVDATGPINIVGNINLTGDILVDGISFKNHIHSGITIGPDDTGKPKEGGA